MLVSVNWFGLVSICSYCGTRVKEWNSSQLGCTFSWNIRFRGCGVPYLSSKKDTLASSCLRCLAREVLHAIWNVSSSVQEPIATAMHVSVLLLPTSDRDFQVLSLLRSKDLIQYKRLSQKKLSIFQDFHINVVNSFPSMWSAFTARIAKRGWIRAFRP